MSFELSYELLTTRCKKVSEFAVSSSSLSWWYQPTGWYLQVSWHLVLVQNLCTSSTNAFFPSRGAKTLEHRLSSCICMSSQPKRLWRNHTLACWVRRTLSTALICLELYRKCTLRVHTVLTEKIWAHAKQDIGKQYRFKKWARPTFTKVWWVLESCLGRQMRRRQIIQ
jgi:hypothetical protein